MFHLSSCNPRASFPYIPSQWLMQLPQRNTDGMMVNYSLKDLQIVKRKKKRKKKKKVSSKIASNVPWNGSNHWNLPSCSHPGPEPGAFQSFCHLSGSAVLRRCCTKVSETCFCWWPKRFLPTLGQQQFSGHVPWASLEPWQWLPQYRLMTCITKCLWKQK